MGRFAEMELPEFVLTWRAINRVSGIHRQLAPQVALVGEGYRKFGLTEIRSSCVPEATARRAVVRTNAADEGFGGVKVSGWYLSFLVENQVMC